MLAAFAMVAIVRFMLPVFELRMTVAQTIGWLVAGIVTGVAVYIVAVGALWWAAGRPASAEGLVLERVRAMWARLTRKH